MISKLLSEIRRHGIIYIIIHGPAYLIRISPLILFYRRVANRLLGHSEERFSHSLEQSQIAILGRGPSLRYVFELQSVPTFVIVNRLENDCVIKKTLKHKSIIHFASVTEPTLSFWQYLTLNFVGYQLSTMQKGDDMYEWRSPRKRKGKPELYGFTPKFLSAELNAKLQEHFPTGVRSKGLLCVMFVAEVSNANDIYTVGIDFYTPDHDTYLNSRSKYPDGAYPTRQYMKDLEKICSLYPNKQFHVITAADFDPDESNISVYKRKMDISSAS